MWAWMWSVVAVRKKAELGKCLNESCGRCDLAQIVSYMRLFFRPLFQDQWKANENIVCLSVFNDILGGRGSRKRLRMREQFQEIRENENSFLGARSSAVVHPVKLPLIAAHFAVHVYELAAWLSVFLPAHSKVYRALANVPETMGFVGQPFAFEGAQRAYAARILFMRKRMLAVCGEWCYVTCAWWDMGATTHKTCGLNTQLKDVGLDVCSFKMKESWVLCVCLCELLSVSALIL